MVLRTVPVAAGTVFTLIEVAERPMAFSSPAGVDKSGFALYLSLWLSTSSHTVS